MKVLCLLALVVFANAETDGLVCEKIDKCFIEDIHQCCYMNKNTIISSRDTKMAILKDETLQGVNFADNPKIEFLPNDIYKEVPNLIHYHAFNASIKEISKKNFQNLDKMEYLYLTLNKIERVDRNAFEGLMELREVRLDYNRIKTLSGKAFFGLGGLWIVGLEKNVCIDEHFIISSEETWSEEISKMVQKISKKCAAESEDDETVAIPRT